MIELAPPPTRVADTEKINPCQLLLDLHDHAVGQSVEPSRVDALAELALAAAVIAWWSRWQPAMIHVALKAGADLGDSAAATGLDIAEVIGKWWRWAEVQTRADIGGHPLLDPEEVRTVCHRLAEEASR